MFLFIFVYQFIFTTFCPSLMPTRKLSVFIIEDNPAGALLEARSPLAVPVDWSFLFWMLRVSIASSFMVMEVVSKWPGSTALPTFLRMRVQRLCFYVSDTQFTRKP
jgi:hypothetical protein